MKNKEFVLDNEESELLESVESGLWIDKPLNDDETKIDRKSVV